MSEYEMFFWALIAVMAFLAFGIWSFDLRRKQDESDKTEKDGDL